MICPQTKAKCKNLAFCDMTGKCLEHEADLLTPPPPTLAEIERLMHEHETKAISYYKYGANADEANLRQSRAALMAAIQKYGS